MPKILTRLRIDEVSAVDRGAGDGVKIMLMKRAMRPDATPADTLRAFPLPNTFNAVLARMEAEAMVKAADGDDDVTDIDKAHRDRGGAHNLTGALLEHLHDRLDRRRERHGFTKHEETKMDTTQTLIGIMKDHGGPVSLCKAIVDRERSPCGEAELVAAITKFAADASGEAGDVAFAKLYESDPMVREACQIAKAAEFNAFNVTPVQVGGAAAQDVDNPSAALAALHELGRKLYPQLTEAQAFEKVFTDPKHRDLAARAHVRPTPPPGSAYPMPR
jgi:hypothetical protein